MLEFFSSSIDTSNLLVVIVLVLAMLALIIFIIRR